MARKLSETRVRILQRLASVDLERHCAETGSEIAHALTISNTGAVLANMEVEGLAKRLGSATPGGRTWTITDLGRQALASAEETRG